MERWNLRELQQDTFLKKLFREAEKLASQEDEAEGDYYDFFRELAILVLMTLPTLREKGIDEAMEDVEVASDSKVNAQFFSMLRQIKEFMKIPEEGVYLVWKIAEESIGRTASPFTEGYGHQRVMEQEKVYGGRSTDEAPENEVAAAIKEADGL